jgi:3-hydroxyacyl-[acyl-carrier-protein] dehydratase
MLPGAVLLDAALDAIQRDRDIDLEKWLISSVKFLEPVRPGDVLRILHASGDDGPIRFTIQSDDRVIVAGTLSIACG